MSAMVMLSYKRLVCKRRKKYSKSCADMEHIDGRDRPVFHTLRYESVRRTIPLFTKLSGMTNITFAVTILMSALCGMLNYVRSDSAFGRIA